MNVHALSGAMQGRHAVSINHENRIILTLDISERQTILLEPGSHDGCYR